MEKKILVYDDNGTESEEFCTMLAQLSSQTVKVNTRALTPPLLSFTTSSLTAICAVTNVNTCDIDHIFFSFSDTGLRDIANGRWNIGMVFMAGFFMARRKRKDIAIGGDKKE